MPIYEYSCSSCGRDFEVLVRGNEQPRCPWCHQGDLEKRLSVPAAHVTGAHGLDICAPAQGGCGLPQCGFGGCQSEGRL